MSKSRHVVCIPWFGMGKMSGMQEPVAQPGIEQIPQRSVRERTPLYRTVAAVNNALPRAQCAGEGG
ncbi:MAG: hypothetical protein K5657_00305 [Desulfovibrio sp.]|nr:hypothetical protein [Desulfovibrio sp.]